MAVASGQTHPRIFLQSGWTAGANKLHKNSRTVTPADSDDEYDYVSSLAEQIAHAMLDDEDCGEDSNQTFFLSCSPPSELESQDTMYDPLQYNSKISKDSEAGIIANVVATTVFTPFTREDSARLSPDRFDIAHDCKLIGTDAMFRAPLFGEAAVFPFGVNEISQLCLREGSPHCIPQMKEAVGALSQLQSSVAEKFQSAAESGPVTEKAVTTQSTNVLSPTSRSESWFQGTRLNHGWQRGVKEHTNGRSRHGVRRKQHDSAKSVRHALPHPQASQANSPRRQSPLQELRDSAGPHALLPGHSPVRTESTGTGVFLPRIACSGSSHRRKAESVTVASKATQSAQSANDGNFRGGKHKERVYNRVSIAS